VQAAILSGKINGIRVVQAMECFL